MLQYLLTIKTVGFKQSKYSNTVPVVTLKNSVITDSMGPSIFFRYNCGIVITVKANEVYWQLGTNKFYDFSFFIAVNLL